MKTYEIKDVLKINTSVIINAKNKKDARRLYMAYDNIDLLLSMLLNLNIVQKRELKRNLQKHFPNSFSRSTKIHVNTINDDIKRLFHENTP